MAIDGKSTTLLSSFFCFFRQSDNVSCDSVPLALSRGHAEINYIRCDIRT